MGIRKFILIPDKRSIIKSITRGLSGVLVQRVLLPHCQGSESTKREGQLARSGNSFCSHWYLKELNIRAQSDHIQGENARWEHGNTWSLDKHLMSRVKYPLSLCLVLSSILYFPLKNAVLIFLSMVSFIPCFLLNALKVLKSPCNRILDTLQNASTLLPSWILYKFSVSNSCSVPCREQDKRLAMVSQRCSHQTSLNSHWGLTDHTGASTVFCIILSSNLKNDFITDNCQSKGARCSTPHFSCCLSLAYKSQKLTCNHLVTSEPCLAGDGTLTC